MKRLLLILFGLLLTSFILYIMVPQVKFYAHFGIWPPAFCNNFEFTQYPDIFGFLGMEDGVGGKANFEISKDHILSFIEQMEPEDIWLKYSESNPNLRDTSISQPQDLPIEVLNGKVKLMLWSSSVKGDYYNIWIHSEINNVSKVSISMPFN